MNTHDAEKAWFHNLGNGTHQAPPTTAPAKEAQETTTQAEEKKGRGFDDIAGMNELKQMVIEGFINVLRHPECAEVYGIKPPSMLFYGPAGCGKTFFAEKMAEELGIHFMKIVPDDLACTWVHGTQQKIGEVFRKAEKKAPTLLFFDEFDAMVPRRTGDENNQHYDNEVNEFLCMLNNSSERGIYVLAATNHPERIDKAVLRTGRIDELVYIDMPDVEARRSLFSLSLKKLPTEEHIDLQHLAEITEGYNCSDRENGSAQDVQRINPTTGQTLRANHTTAARRHHRPAKPLGKPSRLARIRTGEKGPLAQRPAKPTDFHRISLKRIIHFNTLTP